MLVYLLVASIQVSILLRKIGQRMKRLRNINLFKRVTLILFALGITFIIALQLFLTISGLGISVLDIWAQTLPQDDPIDIAYRDSYLVEPKSYFEKQERGQCAGFSSAYLLRILGNQVSGGEAYQRLGHKFSNGYVMPQALLDLFGEYNYKAVMFHGELEHLKTRLNQGDPVIVLIGHFIKWQHYVTFVGYDEEHIFLYDSNRDTDNSKGYNRVITNAEFLSQWKNEIPLFEQIYFVVSE